MKFAATIAALCALTLAAPTSETKNQGTKVPYSRKRHQAHIKPDGSVDFDKFLKLVKSTIRKYNVDIEVPDSIKDLDSILKRANVPLTDFSTEGSDELYYGTGTVGSGAQPFTFDFDTGSSDTFVPGPRCSAAQGCDGTVKYSQTGIDQGNTTAVTYGSGEVSGENYFDSVTVGGLTATHQSIISLTDASGFSGTGSDSLMGFGFQSIAASNQPPYFFTLINEGKVDPPEFSFYLGREQSGTGGDSELTLGGRDASKYTGSFTELPVTDEGYWQVAIDGAAVTSGLNLPALITTAGQAAIDTGTTLVVAPTLAATSIFLQIPGAIPLVTELPTLFFAYPCNSNPNVSLIFAGESFAINPLDFNFGPLSEGSFLCLAAIMGADVDPSQELYVVGDTFLKNWYSTYTVGTGGQSSTVSFAKAV